MLPLMRIINGVLIALGFVLVLVAVQSTAIGAGGPVYFPPASAEWAHIDPAAAGWDVAALDTALEYARSKNASGIVILQGGRILAERDWPVKGSPAYSRMRIGTTPDGHPLEDVASAQKSVVGFLAGVVEGRNELDLSAPVDRYLGKGWSKADGAAEAAITVRHLMTMTSGLNDAGEYQQPAGRVWRYNTGMYSKMVPVLEKASGTDIETLTRTVLTGPAGMTDSKWMPRPWAAGNDAANAIGFVTTPRDFARYGLVVLAGGAWNGKDLLRNPSYLARMLTSSQNLNPSYGLLWWLNGQPRVQLPRDTEAHPGSLMPHAPADLVAMLGALDRKCYVVPSLTLVVSRLGDQAGDDFDDAFWALMMRAARSSNR
jgi:CubicO group peptidase (beta-lactamase class C family)